MSNKNLENNKHLLWRSGFGIDYKNITELSSINTKNLTEKIFETSKNYTPKFIDVADESIKEVYEKYKDAKDLKDFFKNEIDEATKRKIRQQSREDIKKLNTTWLFEMLNSSSSLNEKMALFWHGHFACRETNIIYVQKLLHEIRTNALGNFGDLLKAVSKSAAMLSFLNNQQNKKQKPNENFAREVMELFTLGRGNYTEQDIKEAAKAFTGWSFNPLGEFDFKRMQHDDSSKTVLGKNGFFDGDDVLNILLEQKQTATFITTKIYKYFVNENVDLKHIDWLSKRFFESKYDIKKLMQDIFTSTWFFDKKNLGCKIKSPVELLVGIQKQIPLTLEKPEVLLNIQKALGQVLLYPPNVAGWPGGKNWIDTSTLMIRLQIPKLIESSENFDIQTKADDDVQMGMKEKPKMENIGSNKFKIKANINWADYIKQFEKTKREDLLNIIKNITLSSCEIKDEVLTESIDSSSRETYIKSATITLMSLPEYQMC